MKTRSRVPGVLTLVVLLLPFMVAADDSPEQERSSTPSSHRAGHELTHVLQQRSGATKEQSTDDPDWPVITGRVPNAQAGDGSVPTETLSLNFEKVQLASVRVSERLRHKDRMYFRGKDNRIYQLPDGKYANKAGDAVQVSLGRVRFDNITLKRGMTSSDAGSASGDVVVKGSKIKENAADTGEEESGQATGRRTYEPIVIRKRIDKSSPAAAGSQTAPSQTRVITMAPSTGDGRYTGPGGAWFELSNGEIAAIGGQLERHHPPPYVDVNGDGSMRLRKQ